MPVEGALELKAGKEMGVEFFLQTREMRIINVGETGIIILDGEEYKMNKHDGIYIGMGTREVIFKSKDGKNPAKFYINSVPVHHIYPTVKINIKDANLVHLGDNASLNKRTIYQFIHPNVCKSCQLLM